MNEQKGHEFKRVERAWEKLEGKKKGWGAVNIILKFEILKKKLDRQENTHNNKWSLIECCSL